MHTKKRARGEGQKFNKLTNPPAKNQKQTGGGGGGGEKKEKEKGKKDERKNVGGKLSGPTLKGDSPYTLKGANKKANGK